MKPQVCNHCWKKLLNEEERIRISHEYLDPPKRDRDPDEKIGIISDTLTFHVECWKEIAGEDYIPKPKPTVGFDLGKYVHPEKYTGEYDIDFKFEYNMSGFSKYCDKYGLDKKSFYDAIAIPKEYLDPSDKK